jgi:uncharacterized protein YjlB
MSMEINIVKKLIPQNGNFPNNPDLPLLIYKNAIELPVNNAAAKFEEIFEKNKWGSFWRNGIFNYHHYHSTAHEVLGIYRGKATVQFGGPEGFIADVIKGDVIIIPAGVAHKNLGDSKDFACVGAYPGGQDYDMNYGNEGERPKVDFQIQKVNFPQSDPILGESGGLIIFWNFRNDTPLQE